MDHAASPSARQPHTAGCTRLSTSYAFLLVARKSRGRDERMAQSPPPNTTAPDPGSQTNAGGELRQATQARGRRSHGWTEIQASHITAHRWMRRDRKHKVGSVSHLVVRGAKARCARMGLWLVVVENAPIIIILLACLLCTPLSLPITKEK